jgi:hypothetical protein
MVVERCGSHLKCWLFMWTEGSTRRERETRRVLWESTVDTFNPYFKTLPSSCAVSKQAVVPPNHQTSETIQAIQEFHLLGTLSRRNPVHE